MIKNGYAVKKTDASMSILNRKKKEEEALDLMNRKKALELKTKLEKEKISFKVKTGDNDRVIGSVSVKQIKEKLEKYNIDKNQINIVGSLNSLGFHEVYVTLYRDIEAIIRVELKK